MSYLRKENHIASHMPLVLAKDLYTAGSKVWIPPMFNRKKYNLLKERTGHYNCLFPTKCGCRLQTVTVWSWCHTVSHCVTLWREMSQADHEEREHRRIPGLGFFLHPITRTMWDCQLPNFLLCKKNLLLLWHASFCVLPLTSTEGRS